MRKKIIFLLIFVFLFLSIGYYYSDHFYYTRIIRENHLKTPVDVYFWVLQNNPSAEFTKTRPAPYVSPRFNIENKRLLFCDEGSIVIATLDNELGYQTRLIDLIGFDSLAHHTILEVYENNRWKKYDFFRSKYDQPYVVSAVGFKLLRIKVKEYPKLYNFFLKKLFFFLRKIDEAQYK